MKKYLFLNCRGYFMIANLEIIFDFKNSKEYISSYALEEVDNKKNKN